MNPTPTASDPNTDSADSEQKTFDLSITQILGGALAAMTAAYLGSRMSVAGTVIGAAIASIVAGVAGTLYTASLRHTRDKVRSVWTGRTNDTPTEVVVTRQQPVPDWGQGVTAASTAPAESLSPVTPTYPVAAAGSAAQPAAAGTPLWKTGRFWTRIAIGAVATFVLAFAAITGLELVSGQALSGGGGTTVSRVNDPKPAKPVATPSESPSESPSASPSEEASESPSATPTPDPSDEATQTPSAEPTTEPSATQTSEPPASSSPSAPVQTPAPDGNREGTGDAAGGSGDAPGSAGGAERTG